MISNTYCASDNNEDFVILDENITSMDDAIAAAWDEFHDATCVFVGRAKLEPIEEFVHDAISAGDVVDILRQHMYDTSDETFSTWLEKVSPDDLESLEKSLNACIVRWLRDTGNVPEIYTPADIVQVRK